MFSGPFQRLPYAGASLLGAALIIAACSSPTAPAIEISLSPTSTSVGAGASQLFTATIENASNSSLTWSASGGTIQGSGTSVTWIAPLSGGPYTVTATSVQDASKSASATVAVTPVSVTIDPTAATVAAGGVRSLTATVGSSVNSAVTWTSSGGTIGETVVANTIDWTAPITGGSYMVTATSVLDPTRSSTATITVTPIVVSLGPTGTTIGAGGTQAITATVTGGTSTGVTWSSSAGSITGTGSTVSWNAPVTGGTYTITATSIQDPSRSSTLEVVVTSVNVALTPLTPAMFRGQPRTFTATVTGAAPGGTAVTWASTCASIAPNGSSALVTAPNAPGTCTVTATSDLDPTRSANTLVTIRPEWLVTSTDDTNDGSCNFVHCSLREALIVANAAPDSDVILFDADAPAAGFGSFRTPSAEPTSGTIMLLSPLPSLSTPIEIRGPGAGLLTVNAGGSIATPMRVFHVTGNVDVEFADLTLRGGRATNGAGLLLEAGSRTTLTRTVLTDNHALSGPGGAVRLFGGSTLFTMDAIFDDNRALTAGGNGGGLSIEGGSAATLEGGSIRNSVSEGSFGGGIYVTGSSVTVNDVVISENTSGAGAGIAGWNSAMVTIEGGAIRDNTASRVGGGIIVGASSTSPGVQSTLNMTDAILEDNVGVGQGGGLQATRNVQVFLTRVLVQGNRVTGTVAGGASLGAGLMFGDAVTGTVDNSTIRNNSVEAITGFADDGGGGIVVTGIFVPTTLLVRYSTISNNTAIAAGGGILVVNTSTITVENSTIHGNMGGTGGGIVMRSPGHLRNLTISGNSTTTGAGGLGTGTGGTANLTNVLLSANTVGGTPGNCASAGSGMIVSQNNNLSDDATCSAALALPMDHSNTPAGLAAGLADNGGPTLTQALLIGSAAIDAGGTCSEFDQRGAPRVGGCDIGAFEFGATLPPLMNLSPVPAAAARLFKLGPPAKAPAVTVPLSGLGPVVGGG